MLMETPRRTWMRTLIFTGTACQPILMSFWFSPTQGIVAIAIRCRGHSPCA